jgi:hypothetical protein
MDYSVKTSAFSGDRVMTRWLQGRASQGIDLALEETRGARVFMTQGKRQRQTSVLDFTAKRQCVTETVSLDFSSIASTGMSSAPSLNLNSTGRASSQRNSESFSTFRV